jgi:hypothetical protein
LFVVVGVVPGKLRLKLRQLWTRSRGTDVMQSRDPTLMAHNGAGNLTFFHVASFKQLLLSSGGIYCGGKSDVYL